MAHTYALYQCVDGFRGSKEECMAHEKEANLPDPSEYAANTLTVAPPALHHDVVLLRIYESEVLVCLQLCVLFFQCYGAFCFVIIKQS